MFPTLWFGGGGGSWTPATPGALQALWIADAQYCFEDSSGLDPCENGDAVAVWKDASGNGNHLSNATVSEQPIFHSTSWNGSHAGVTFDGSNDQLIATSGSILSTITGTDQPFTVFVAVQGNSFDSNDQALCAWDDTTPGSSYSLVRTDNLGSGRTRYMRVDASAATGAGNNTIGTVEIGNGYRRLGYIYTGTAISTFVGSQGDLSAVAADVGACTFNRFRMGNGPGGVNVLDGQIGAMAVYSGAKTLLDYSNFRAWATTVLGA